MIFSRFVTKPRGPTMKMGGSLQRLVFRGVSCIQWGPLWDEHLGCQAEPRIWVRRLGSPERTNNPSRRLAVPSSGDVLGGILWKLEIPKWWQLKDSWKFLRFYAQIGGFMLQFDGCIFFQVGWFNHQLDSFFWGHHPCCFFLRRF